MRWNSVSYLIGVPMEHVEVIYRKRAMKRMANTMRDDHHPANELYETLPIFTLLLVAFLILNNVCI